MKRIITAVTILFFSLIATSVSAQNGYRIKGVVVDSQGPVIGATVMEKGTTTGTPTGLDGDFDLTVSSADAVVEVSCIGYASQTFTAGSLPASILLVEDTEFLDDVVVIGYGTVKKSDLTGSVSTVKADEVNKGVISSPVDLLRGKTAGVVVTAGDGMPGSAATVRIRGGASLSASTTPLYVIDGLPVSNDGLGSMADPMASINPEDIESFSVLKDASATAIYGSRASNGVIVITTKKGSKTAQAIPQVAVDFTSSLNTIAKYNPVMDAAGLRKLIRDGLGEGSSAEAALGNADTNWQKEIFHMAPSYDGNVSVNGKIGNFMPYRVSAGFTEQNGTLKGSKMDRGTLSLNLSPSFFDKHLTVNLNGKGVYARNTYANQDAIWAANQFDPTKPVKTDGHLGGYTTWYDAAGNVNTMATPNPVALLEGKIDYGDTYRFLGNTQFDYKVHGFEDLRLNLNLGIDWAKSNSITEFVPNTIASLRNTDESGGGSHKDYDITRRDTTLEFYADYNKTFAQKHNVDFMAGYSWQHFWNNSHEKRYRISDKHEFKNTEGLGELYLISFFGRANYGFDDRYLITATLRADGTSRFQNNKWGIFPSVALGWNVKNESFLKYVEPVSTAKVRLSWGETGQQEIGGYYDTFAQFLQINTPGSYYFVNGNNYIAPIAATAYSANLKWETTTTYNGGLDFGLWNDRLTTSIDVYKRDTRDILNTIPVPALSNFTNLLPTNIGSMTNYGFEINLNGVIIEKRDMSWTVGVNMAYNHNEVTKLTASDENAAGIETGGLGSATGNNVQLIQVGYPLHTFNLFQQVYDASGMPIYGVYVDQPTVSWYKDAAGKETTAAKDANGKANTFIEKRPDGVIDSNDRRMTYSADPTMTFGFNTMFTWKNWTAALSGHAATGNWVYYDVASGQEPLMDLWTNSFVSNRLQSAPKSMFPQAQYFTDYFLHDGSYVKIDNITVGYTFPKLFSIAQDRPASLNIFGTVQNVCTITKYPGIDPEVYGGIDGNVYPRPRTFILGLKFNF